MREFTPNDAFLRYAPAVSSGSRDIAARHDEYLAAPPARALHAPEESAPVSSNWRTAEPRSAPPA